MERAGADAQDRCAMMTAMTKTPSPLRRAIGPFVTLLVMLVVFAPVLLLGESMGPLGLVFVAAGLLGGGFLLSHVGGTDVRTIGKLVAVVGLLLLIAALVLLVLAIEGLGRPF